MAGFHKSIFVPINTVKFKGTKYPTARSSWELSCMQYFDRNPQILEWASEPFFIPYVKPTDGKIHKYYPDFLIIYRTKDGGIKKELIEIKPSSQSRASRSKNTLRRIAETVVYSVNMAKWNAAQQWCTKNDCTFRVLTEKGDMSRKSYAG